MPSDAPPSPPPRRPRFDRRRRRSTDESIKETIDSVVIAFILTFVFRAFVMEAFVIPTGSMAPTLLGQHVGLTCPQCGHRFDADASGRTQLRTDVAAPCPLCFYRVPAPRGTATRAGDRLLVQKYLYAFAEPRRFDVVVFRNPQAVNPEDQSPGPTTNYIKRLVGLPHEELTLFEGNVYVRPPAEPGQNAAAWRIARKTDPRANPRWRQIQDALWQPVFRSVRRPADGGVADVDGRVVRDRPWRDPFLTRDPAGWSAGPAGSYRFDPDAAGAGADARGSAAPAPLRFDWGGYPDRGVYHPYNVTIAGAGLAFRQPILDVRLAVTLAADGPGVGVTLRTHAPTRADRATAQPVSLTYAANGELTLDVAGRRQTARSSPVRPGRPVRLELWYVDAEALALVDGRVRLRIPVRRDLDRAKQQAAPPDRPEISLHVRGGPARLLDVQVDRDLYYTPSLESTGEYAPVGTVWRDFRDDLRETPPLRLPADRFYVLGDNGPISNDARFWDSVEPWTRRRLGPDGADAPLNEHEEPQSLHHVPRDLLMGRAFFVYWPAPYAFGGDGQQVVPNIADMRLIY